MSHVLVSHDFKFEANVWRGEVAETFRKTKQIRTNYLVADGQIIKTVESTWEYASAEAERSVQIPEVPATFLYVDGSYRADPEYIFQKTHIKTTTYSAYGDTSYLLTIADLNVLTGVTQHSTSIVDGKLPLAPTVSSNLSNLIQQPITGVLDDACDTIPATIAIDSPYAQDEGEAAALAKRRMQRETAIVRRVKHGVNPLMRIGQTVQLIDDKRGVDARHIITGKSFSYSEEGAADETLEMENWIR